MKEIQTSQNTSFYNKVKGWETEIARQESEAKVIPIRRILSIAATVLIIALATVYAVLRIFPGQSNDELFAEYFQPYEDVITERSGEENALQQGMSLYNEKKYSMAIPYLETYLKEKPTEAAVQLYLGISYLADDKTSQAKDLFESLIRNEQGLYKDVAQWNLALIYLKTNEKGLLKKTLQEIIVRKDHPYNAEAAALNDE
jgi:tetratricopeptide (TPR) repeat protein